MNKIELIEPIDVKAWLNKPPNFNEWDKVKKIEFQHTEIFGYIKESNFELSILDLINKTVWLIRNSSKFTQLLSIIVTLILKGKSMFKDWKTTITSIVKAIIIILTIIGIQISPEQQELILTTALSIYAVIEVIGGWFSKDKDNK
jgi:hypothetical protein